MKNRYDRLMGSGIECLCQKKESDKDHIVTVILLIVVLSFLDALASLKPGLFTESVSQSVSQSVIFF